MADVVKRFSPFFLQKFPGANRDEIIDRNLLAIQQAIEQANVTITKNTTDITRIFEGDTSIVVTGAQGPPGIDASDGDGSGDAVSIPGPPGARGRDGVGLPGLDGEDGDTFMIPGPAGRAGPAGAVLVLGDTADDQTEPPFGGAPAITWPAAKRVLFSTGTSSPPAGNSAFQWDDSTRVLFIGAGASQAWANLGNLGDANTEYVESAWSSNVWILKSKKTGVGTVVRSMTIDADTATLTLNAATAINLTSTTGISVGTAASTAAVTVAAGTSVTISAGTGTHPSALFQQSKLTIDTSIALSGGFAAGSTWAGLTVNGSASVPGTGTITAVFGSTYFSSPTITGTGVGATVNEAATVLIGGGPSQSGLTINVKYALYVQGDVTRLDGQVWLPTVANGAVATALTSVGPAGSHTTVQKWFVLYDTGGTAYYVPGF